jgi:hypothetical protein
VTLGTIPKICSYAFWYCHPGAGGKYCTTKSTNDINMALKKPTHMIRREQAYPYTSVRMSPKMYATGKMTIAPGNAKGPRAKSLALDICVIR